MMSPLTFAFILCGSGLLISGCARPVLPVIDVGDYDEPKRALPPAAHSKEGSGTLTCDAAVESALKMPVLLLLKRAESVLSSARGQKTRKVWPPK